jgi:hypothetical protein
MPSLPAPADLETIPVTVRRQAGIWLVLFGLGAVTGGGAVHTWDRSVPVPELPPRHLEATIFLPLTGHADRPFTEAEWHKAVDLLVAEFGGATLGAPQEGCWRDSEGRLQREPVRPVIVSFEHERLADFRRTIDEVGRRLGQEAIYARFEEPRIELRPVQPAGSPK